MANEWSGNASGLKNAYKNCINNNNIVKSIANDTSLCFVVLPHHPKNSKMWVRLKGKLFYRILFTFRSDHPFLSLWMPNQPIKEQCRLLLLFVFKLGCNLTPCKSQVFVTILKNFGKSKTSIKLLLTTLYLILLSCHIGNYFRFN